MDSEDQKRYALTLALLSAFLTPFMSSSINVALPAISDEFGMTAVRLSWVATSYLLAAAAFLLPFGRVADIRGRKKVFLMGMWVFMIASALCALAPSADLLIASRYVQGLGAAMMFGTSIAIISSVYPPNERGKAFGLSVSVTYIGLSAGPVLGGFLTSFLGWRSIFLVPIPLMAAVIWLGSTKLKGEWSEAKGERYDPQGSTLYILSITAVIVGFSLLPDIAGIVLTVAGVVVLTTFVLWELRQASPVLDMRLFRHNRAFAFSNMAALINYMATFAVGFMMSLYLQFVKGFSPEETGLMLMSQTVVMAAFSPVAGKLSDRIEPQFIASAGMAVAAAGLVGIAFFGSGTPAWTIIAVLAVLGFGFALFSSPNTNAIMSAVEKRHYGTAAASVGTMRLIGQVMSMGIASMFLAIYVGRVEITADLAPEFLSAFKPAFIVFAALCSIGVLASLARGKVRNGAGVQ
jgi:EmrB/QacA subfamily drug resistance transporter